MATLFKASGGTIGTLVPTTSWAAPNGLFPTTDRNDGSAYTWTSSTSTVTLPSSGLADGYLVVAAFEYEDSSNGRFNPVGRIQQTGGTGNFVTGYATGYSRDASEDRAYVRTWGFVDNPSASATLQFQWTRDTDAPGASDGTVRSEFQVIPFYYSDIGLYSSTYSTATGGTTPSQITGFTGTDGTNITITSDTVSVTGDNKRYLLLGGAFHDINTGRTQRWYGFDIDGTFADEAKGYAYLRSNADGKGGEMFTHLIETATATRTVELHQYRGYGVSDLQGGADADVATSSTESAHAMVVIELNDAAEVFSSIADAQSSLLATTGPVDLAPCTTTGIVFNDSASFTRSSDNAMNVEVTTDILLGANVSAASNSVASTTRWTAYAEFTINGTENPDSVAGDYMRNNQTSQDTFGWSANLLGFEAVTAGDDVGVSVTELSGSEGGGAGVSPASWTGFWGINLDTLEAAAGADHTALPTEETLALAGKVPTLSIDAVSAPIAIDTPYVELRLVVIRGLNLDGHAPTIDVTTSTPITREPAQETLALEGQAPSVEEAHFTDVAAETLALEGQVPVADRTDNHVVTPEATALAVEGQAPEALRTESGAALPGSVELLLSGQALTANVTHSADPSTDTLVLSGYAPTVLRFNAVVPAEDALALEGQAPTVDVTHSADPAVATLVLEGQAPTAARVDNHVALPAAATLALAGQAPTSNLTHSAAPAEVDLALTGEAPIALGNESYAITVPYVELRLVTWRGLLLQGYTPTVVVNHLTTPAEEDLVLAGQAPTAFRESGVAPTEESLVLAGQAPTAARTDNHVAAPAATTLTLTGQAPTLLRVDSYSPTAAALLLAGQAPTVSTTAGIDITPDAVALALAGQAPTLTTSFQYLPGEVTLTLAGYAPVVLRTQSASPSAGSLTLVGKIASVGLADSLIPNEDTLALSGYAPVITTTLSAVPAQDALVLTGQSPTVGRADTVQPGAASLTLTGLEPPSDAELAPPAGSLTLEGRSFTIISIPDTSVAVPQGTLGLTGYASTRAYGLLLRGYEPNVAFSSPTPNKGSLTLSGNAPILVNTTPQPTDIQTFRRQVVLEGFAPALEMGSEAELSSLGLEGWAPVALATSPIFYPPRAELQFTGYAPQTTVEAAPGNAFLSLGSYAPSLLISDNKQVAPAAVALTLTGQQPLVSSDISRILVPDEVTLTLAGQQVYLGRSITPAAVARRLNGKVPTVTENINRTIEPGVAALTLTGYAPPALNIGYNLTIPSAGLGLNTGYWEDVKQLPFYGLPILRNNAAVSPIIADAGEPLGAAYYSIPMDSPDHYAELEITDWVVNDYTSPWLWVRAANTEVGGSGYYNYIYPYLGTLWVNHARWDAPSTYVRVGADINTGLSDVVPDGSILRLEVSGTTLTTSLDTGGGFQVLLVNTIGSEYADQTGVGFGIEDYPQPLLAVDSFRAGPSPAILDDFNRTTLNLGPLVNQTFVRATPAGDLTLNGRAVTLGETRYILVADGQLLLSSERPRKKIKRTKYDGARTRLVSLTTNYMADTLFR